MATEDYQNSPSPMLVSVKRAYNASLVLEKTKGADRSRGIEYMAQGLEKAKSAILEANTLDLETSREMAVPELILDWLKLTPERLQKAICILQRLAELSDPIERLMNAPYQLDPGQTYCQRMPLGVIALIYEAFPELAAIAAGLCLKTGNSLIVRGGMEASHCNGAIAKALQEALLKAGLPFGCLEFLSAEEGSSIRDLVNLDQYINLVIPYGRPSLIQHAIESSTAPVLKSAMGNCYLYWALSGDLDLVRWMILDSHESVPDPVNAIEKVLISSERKSSSKVSLFNSLQEKGFKLRGDKQLVEEFPEHLTPVEKLEWSTPYLDKIIAFKEVDSLSEAIAWMNRYSSNHADCLVSESYQESRQFAMGIDSALVYINSSPRFSRNPKGGESVFLGMSNQKGNRLGLIGLETFTTMKQVVQGDGRY